MTATKLPGELLGRIQGHARAWGVVVEDTFETESSAIAFGNRDNLPVVLKVIKQPGDEWRSGSILDAFDGNGVARVYEQAPGAVLIERLQPGHSLADMSLNGSDERATDILAGVNSADVRTRISKGLSDSPGLGQRLRALYRYWR